MEREDEIGQNWCVRVKKRKKGKEKKWQLDWGKDTEERDSFLKELLVENKGQNRKLSRVKKV